MLAGSAACGVSGWATRKGAEGVGRGEQRYARTKYADANRLDRLPSSSSMAFCCCCCWRPPPEIGPEGGREAAAASARLEGSATAGLWRPLECGWCRGGGGACAS